MGAVGVRQRGPLLTPMATIDSDLFFSRAVALGVAGALLLGIGCAARDHVQWTSETQIQPALPVASTQEVARAKGATEVSQPVRDVRRFFRGFDGSPAWGAYNEWRGDPYELDDLPRRLQPGEKMQCEREHLVRYPGSAIKLAGPVQVHPAFVARLERFEALVNEVALEVYGREPTRVHHMGAFSCRKSRNRSARISEHAFGNAIDVSAIEFGPASKEQRAELPPYLRWGFKASVRQHWSATRSESGRLHSAFLRQVAERTVEAGIFRIALGPSHRGHADHFHFDMSPWNYVNL